MSPSEIIDTLKNKKEVRVCGQDAVALDDLLIKRGYKSKKVEALRFTKDKEKYLFEFLTTNALRFVVITKEQL